MHFITEGMIRYHRAMEAAGAVDAEASWAIHMIYDAVPPGKENLLSGCWAYISWQRLKKWAEMVREIAENHRSDAVDE